MENLPGERDFEGGRGSSRRGGGAELLVPTGAEAGAPEALRAGVVGGFARTDGERGEFADAQRSGALIKVEGHGVSGVERLMGIGGSIGPQKITLRKVNLRVQAQVMLKGVDQAGNIGRGGGLAGKGLVD